MISGTLIAACNTQTDKNASPEPARCETIRKLLIQFSASKAFMKKYKEAKALLSNKQGPTAGFEQVFEAILDEFLEKHSPERRQERRERRRGASSNGSSERTNRGSSQRTGNEPGTRTSSESSKGTSNESGKRSNNGTSKKSSRAKRTRHIPAAVRDEVFSRDNGKCTYKGANGKRCGSTLGLHIDHIRPFAKGGSNEASNLRLLCSNHNRLEAERAFGEKFMKQYRRRE